MVYKKNQNADMLVSADKFTLYTLKIQPESLTKSHTSDFLDTVQSVHTIDNKHKLQRFEE